MYEVFNKKEIVLAVTTTGTYLLRYFTLNITYVHQILPNL